MDITTFIQRLKSSKLMPKTAAPPPELFKREFEILAPLGETIFCIHPSTEVSGTVRSAIVASRDFPNADIRVIDTRTIASPLGTLVELAARWAESGVDADAIETRYKTDRGELSYLFSCSNTRISFTWWAYWWCFCFTWKRSTNKTNSNDG